CSMPCSSVQGGSPAPELGGHTCDVFPLNLPNTLTGLRILLVAVGVGARPARERAGHTCGVFPLTLPNTLTVLRILLVPVVVVALLDETPNGDAIAAGVFALAAFTDSLDRQENRT